MYAAEEMDVTPAPTPIAETYTSTAGACLPTVLCPTGIDSNCNHPSTSYPDLASAQADCDVTPTCYAVWNRLYPSNAGAVWGNQDIYQMRTCSTNANCNQPTSNGGNGVINCGNNPGAWGTTYFKDSAGYIVG